MPLLALLFGSFASATLAAAPPRIALSTGSLIPQNPVLGQPSRIGLAVLLAERRSLIPLAEMELFFLHSTGEEEQQWELGLRGGLSVALADDERRGCCELDNQDGYLGLAYRLRRGSWGGGLELEHRVGHRGVEGAFEEHQDSVMDQLLLRVHHEWFADFAVEAAIVVLFRDEPRDRPGFWRLGLFETSGRLRLALGVQAGVDDPIFEAARVRLSYWRAENRSLKLVPYVMAHYGDPLFSARPVEREFGLLIGVEVPLVLSNRTR